MKQPDVLPHPFLDVSAGSFIMPDDTADPSHCCRSLLSHRVIPGRSSHSYVTAPLTVLGGRRGLALFEGTLSAAVGSCGSSRNSCSNHWMRSWMVQTSQLRHPLTTRTSCDHRWLDLLCCQRQLPHQTHHQVDSLVILHVPKSRPSCWSH